MKKLIIAACICCLMCTTAAAQSLTDADINALVEMLRTDLKANKRAVIIQNVALTDAQSKAFWPVYREYETELFKINDQRMAILKDFSDRYASIQDKDSKEFAARYLDFENDRLKLKKNYFKKFSKATSPKTAAKLLQIENKIQMLIDLQIASSVPLIEGKK